MIGKWGVRAPPFWVLRLPPMLGYESCSATVGGAPSFCHCGMPCTFCASAEIDENAWGIRNKGHLVKGQLVKIRTLTEQFIRSASLNTSSLNYIVSLIRDTACTAEPSAILRTAERSFFSLSAAPTKSQKSSGGMAQDDERRHRC